MLVKYLIFTHGHADHASGGQTFQQDGATIVANIWALAPIVGEKQPAVLPDRVFDADMAIARGGETILPYRIAASHNDNMTMALSLKISGAKFT